MAATNPSNPNNPPVVPSKTKPAPPPAPSPAPPPAGSPPKPSSALDANPTAKVTPKPKPAPSPVVHPRADTTGMIAKGGGVYHSSKERGPVSTSDNTGPGANGWQSSGKLPAYVYVKGSDTPPPGTPDKRYELTYKDNKKTEDGKYLYYYKEQVLTNDKDADGKPTWKDTGKSVLDKSGQGDLDLKNPSNILSVAVPTDDALIAAVSTSSGGSSGAGGATNKPGEPSLSGYSKGCDRYTMKDVPDSQGRLWSGTWEIDYDTFRTNSDGQFIDDAGEVINDKEGNPITPASADADREKFMKIVRQPPGYVCKDATFKQEEPPKSGNWVEHKVQGPVRMIDNNGTGKFDLGTAAMPGNSEPLIHKNAQGEYESATAKDAWGDNVPVAVNVKTPQGLLDASFPPSPPFQLNNVGKSVDPKTTQWQANPDGTYTSTRTSPAGNTLVITAKIEPDGKGGSKVVPIKMDYDLTRPEAGNNSVNNAGVTVGGSDVRTGGKGSATWDANIGGFVDSTTKTVRDNKGALIRDAKGEPITPEFGADMVKKYKKPLSDSPYIADAAAQTKAAAAQKAKTDPDIKLGADGKPPATITRAVVSPSGQATDKTFYKIDNPATLATDNPELYKALTTGQHADTFRNLLTAGTPVYVSVNPKTKLTPEQMKAAGGDIQAFSVPTGKAGATVKPGDTITVNDPKNLYTDPDSFKADEIAGVKLPGTSSTQPEFKLDPVTGTYKATGVQRIVEMNGKKFTLTGDYEIKKEDLERGSDGKWKLKQGAQPRLIAETAKMTNENGNTDGLGYTDVADPKNPGKMKRVFFQTEPKNLDWVTEDNQTKADNSVNDRYLNGTTRKVIYMDAFDTGEAFGANNGKTKMVHKVNYGGKDIILNGRIKDHMYCTQDPYSGLSLKQRENLFGVGTPGPGFALYSDGKLQ